MVEGEGEKTLCIGLARSESKYNGNMIPVKESYQLFLPVKY